MSAKSLDKKNRFRNKTVGFRVSPEEWEEIERLVALSGMSKQDYIMHRLQNTEMFIHVNPRVVKALKGELQTKIEQLEECDIEDTLVVISDISYLLNTIKISKSAT